MSIHRFGLWSCILVVLAAPALAQTVSFVDGSGAAASSYLENTEARVRVTHPAADTSPSTWETVSVTLSTAMGGDSETLTLAETDRDSGVFEGTIPLRRSNPPSQAGVLETGISSAARDTLTAAYGSATDTAAMEALRIRFLHEDGQPATGYTEADWVHVQVETHVGGNNPNQVDSLYIQLSVNADDEGAELHETANATGIFEGRLRAVLYSTSDYDGLLGGYSGSQITARASEPDTSAIRTAQVPLVSSRVEILDEEGRPTDFVPEASSIRLRVVDRLAGIPSVGVQVISLLALDEEILYLNQTGQTGTATGVYEGRIWMSIGNRVVGNGTLETTEDPGPPHSFDTIELAYGGSTDTVQTYASESRFVDAWGGDVEIYAAGSTVYLWVEARNRNADSNDVDYIQVTVQGLSTGDLETVSLAETGRSTGVFTGSLPLAYMPSGDIWGDGILQAEADEIIEALHYDILGMSVSADRARVRYTSLQFVEEDGRPTQVLVESGAIRLRALSREANTSPTQVNQIAAQLDSRDGQDQETVTLTETGPDTSVFTAEVPMAWVEPGGALQGNEYLETSNGGSPRFLPDLVTAAAQDVTATAATMGARIRFLDVRGQETGTYAVGETAWVRLEDHNRDANPYMQQTITVVLFVPGENEQEMIQLTETGLATGIFEGGIVTASTAATADGASQSPYNGTLEADSGSRIRVDHQHPHDPNEATAEVVLIQNAVQFEDAEGQPADEYLRGTEVRLRLFYAEGNLSPSSIDTAQVLLAVQHTGDLETVSLAETGPDTGVFTGSRPLRFLPYGSPSENNGFVETGVYYGESSYQADSVTVTHVIWNGPTATDVVSIGTDRIWFVDAAGFDAEAYAVGSRVYVRLEDHGVGQPGGVDSLSVIVKSGLGADEEAVQLQETGPATGIYEGSIATSNLYSPIYNGVLSAEAGWNVDVFSERSSDRARIVEAVVQFIDGQGRPTAELLEGGLARIRSTESAYATDDTVWMMVRSRDGGDEEYVMLTRVSPAAPVYEGEIQMDFVNIGSPPSQDGVLQTSNSGPEYEGDEVTAGIDYREPTAMARAITVGSRIAFVDAAGEEISAFALGETVRVRVEDHNHDDPAYAWTVTVNLYGPGGEQEDLLLTETGLDTNVYEGSLPSRKPNGPFPGNGWLEVEAGDAVDATYSNENRPSLALARATVLGGSVAFVDAQGQPAESYLQSSRAWLRVMDIGANLAPSVVDTVTVALRADISLDTEDLVLTESGPDTGVFLGSIDLDLGFPANDGVLQTGQQTSPPALDTLRATYASGSGTAMTVSAGLVGSRTWFVDEYGNPVDSYAQGTVAYVRVEDQTTNRPALRDSVQVELASLTTNDTETIVFLETDAVSGIFQGSLPLAVSASSPYATNDGRLHAEAGEQIRATHSNSGYLATASTALAEIRYSSVTFIDESGRSTGQVLEGGQARIRVVDVMATTVNAINVRVRSSRGADEEFITANATAPGSGVFEGAVQLEFIQSGSGLSGNGTLETRNSGSPDFSGDTLTVDYQDAEATAVTVASRLQFLDRFGRTVSTFAVGDLVGLRLESHNGDDPATRQTAYVTVRVPQTSETENVALIETGFGTNTYEGAIPSSFTFPNSGNGTLETESAAALIEAEHIGLTTPNPTRAQAAFTTASITFVDADGQPAASYLESTRAYIRVFDAQAGTAPTAPIGVTVRTDLSQDQELVMLNPVEPGVFVGSIAMSTGAVSQGNGTLETGQLDTLRATYQTWQGATATATAGLTSSRAWFVDAYGSPADSYARGTRAYVRVEDHNLDQPGVYNTAQVTVRSLSTGDVETLSLLETAREGGLFAGSIVLEMVTTYPQTPTLGDGKLQSDAPEDIEVVHTDWTGETSSSDRATIQYGAVMFIGEDGEPTVEVVEGGVARIRAIETSAYRGSTVTVRAQSRYGADQEFVILTETPPQSGIYEATVQLGFVSPGGGVATNSVLETSNSGNPAFLGDELTLDYQDAFGYGVTISSRVQFIDAFGRETASFAVGEPVRVRVENHSYPDPAQRQTSSATVRVPATGESEPVTLVETGFGTNVYEGSVPTSGSPAGTLNVQPGDVIRAEHSSITTPSIRFAEAVIAGASVLFVDEAGQPAEIYLESTRALVRVSDSYANQSSSADVVNVTVRSVLGGDQENLTLTETGGMTGVFEGWIGLGTGPIAQGNGTVETRQDLGTPHEFDSLLVSYQSVDGPVTDTVGTISSRTAFVDAYGSPTDTYARGTRAYVRVEDHNLDQPGVYNTAQVTVRSLSTGDIETLSLLETAREGGLFAGSIVLEMVNTYPPTPTPGDGKLQSDAPEDIEVVHTDWTGETSSSDRASIQYGAVTFIGEDGEPTVEVVEGGVARIRAIETSVYRSSTVTVRAKSRYAADQEFVILTETPPQSGNYEGTVQLGFVAPGSGVATNSVLETSNSGNPAYLGDELTLDYQDAFGYGVTISSRVQFIDAFGRETASFAVGEPVRVRVENHNFPDPAQRQTTSVTVSVPATGATDYTSLVETGFDTNVYEGSVPTSAYPSAGTLQVQPGDLIRAEHYSFTTPNIKFAEAVISGASVLFVDESGEPAEVYLESTRALVRVSDSYANQSSSADVLNVIVRSVLGGDQENLILTETGGMTGVFEGSIGLGTGPIALGNGTVETRQDLGTPHEFDSLRVIYSSIAGPVTDTVGTISSRTAFVDAYGSPTGTYARGTRAYVRVEDHNLDQPGVYNTAQVTVRSLSTGDIETLSLLETAREGGLFAGSIVLEMVTTYPQTPTPGDGKLQSDAPEDIEVVHTDWTGETSSSDRANIQYGAVTFIGEDGEPTTEVVEGGMARIRAIETSIYRSSTVTVRAQSRYGADQEYVMLTETPPQSGNYEGTVQLGFVAPGSGVATNSVLETSNSGNPAYLGDELTLDYQDAFGYGVTISSRVQFIDAFGQETASFAVGEPVRVRVENHNFPDPAQRQTTSVTVSVPATGATDYTSLVETGFDTNVYEGSVPTSAYPSAGTLQVQPGDLIRAEHYSFTTPNIKFAEAVISGASVLFVDEASEPAEVYLESTRALVRVSDSYANQSSSADVLNVTVRSVLGGDQENLTLTETGGMTGVFEGSIGLSTGPIAQGNGTVETRQDVGSPHEFDSLRVSYQSVAGPVTDTVGTISSRTAFVDAYGSPADSYARGTRAYVRVEDHNLDQPGVYNTAQVTVRSLSTGDVETLSLLETAREGGLFAGSIVLETVATYPPTPTPGDGKLQSEAQEDIEVVHTDWTGETSSSDRARIEYGAVTFIGEDGEPTDEVVEGGVARIRAIETSYYRGSTVTVRAQSRYGADQEFVILTETPPQSGVYEGTVQLGFVAPGGGVATNSLLETSNSGNPAYLGDELTLDYQDAFGYGVTIASRVQFIDAFGRETSSFAVGEPVRLRVENHGFPDPVQRQTTSAEVTVPATGESEFVQLLETGFDTNVYEGSILSSGTPAAGTLDVQPGDVIRVSHYSFTTPNIKFAEAVILGASVLFVDESGQPAEAYLESTRALVRVSDAFANQSSSADFVSVTVRSVLGGDQETVYLTETGGMTGVFEGEIPMGTGPVFPGNQTLETEQDLGTPHEFDSLRVSYQSVAGPVTDTVGTISSRTAFVDAYGNPAETYARGSRAYVRVEDYNGPNTAQVTFRSLSTGDEETITIPETSLNGVFAGSIALENVNNYPPAPFPGDGKLQSVAEEDIKVVHTDWTGETSSSDRARIQYGAVMFVDESGVLTAEVVEGGVARIRAIETSSYRGSTVTVRATSRYGTDQEYVILTETPPQSGVYEGTVQLNSVAPGSGYGGNGVLETSTSGIPAYLGDELTLDYQDALGYGVVVPSRITFLDIRGEATDEYALRSPVRVRVESHTTSGTTTAVLTTPHDTEALTLNETGAGTGLFEGAIPSSDIIPGTAQDGVLQLIARNVVVAAYNSVEVRATFTNNVAPVAVDDTAETEEQPVTIAVLANDSDPEAGPLQVSTVTQGANGAVVINPDQTVIYTPAAGFIGTDTFTYLASDGQGGEARATVTVTVIASNGPPTPAADTATTEEDQAVVIDVLSNDTDPDNDGLGISAVGLPGQGTAVTSGSTILYTPPANWNGETTFTYQVEDPDGLTASATVTVTVTPVNDPPVAVDDAATTDEDTAVNIAVLANDGDLDNDTLDVTSVTVFTNGVAVLNADETVTFTPTANFSGTASFDYMMSDGTGGGGGTDVGTVTITVAGVNDEPAAVDDTATVEEDGSVVVTVLANDSDPDNDSLVVSAVTQGASGSVAINANGTVTYTPAANFNGTDSFTYTVSDGNGGTDSATVTVTVNAVNDAPVTNNDTATVAEDSSVTVTVLTNDTDVENDALDVTAITQGAHGTVTINPDDTVTYTPVANYNGTDSFSYTVSDGNDTDTATVAVTITSTNDAPNANDDAAAVAEDGSVAVIVLGNDSDADDDTLNVIAVTQGTNGAVVINPDRSLTYTPAANFNGTDSFTYTVSDGNDTDTATVTATITSANDAPNANDDTASAVEDGSVAVTVLGNDTDADDDTLTVTAVTQGTSGAVVINPDNTITYTPAANFFGPDAFTYTVSDGNGGTDTATVTVTVAPSNDALTASDDTASVDEDASVTVAVLSNDSDPENDVLSVESVTQGTNGAVVINPDKTVTYTPNANFNGTDSFTYTANDGNGGTDSATVTVTVTSVNDEPVAGNDTASVVEDGEVSVTVLGNDADADSDLLDVTAATQGNNGSVVVNGDNTVTYTPAADFNGTDSFTYTINDGNGGIDTATVTVTVGAANDAPNANNDATSTAEDAPVTVSVLGNDSDPENDSLSVASVTQGTNGAVVINPNQTVTYTPGANFNGSDSFTYTVSDGNGGTDTATVAVTITPVNDAPVADDDAASAQEDGSVTVTVLTNDSDADNDTLDVTSVTQGTNGSVVLNANDTVTYTPGANFNGSDSFTYTVIDGNGGTDTATVTVSVGAANDAPDAVNDTATVAEDGTSTVTVLTNDTDLDNDTLAVTAVTQGTKGSVVRNADNTVTYTPNANANGADSFTYTISDGNGGTDTATVAVTITPVNDAPVAVNDSANTLAEVPVTIQVRTNDTDIDSATLTITTVTQGAHGSVAINAGQSVTYTPAAAWVGPDTFTYTISDGSGGTATATVSVNVQAPARVSGNIQVLYTFNEGSGTTVTDVSGVGTPLNLTIGSSAAVTWLPGALSIDTNTLVKSASTATKVINASKASNEVTMEAWVVPTNLTQTGPAAIVTLSQTATKRNATLGQSGTLYNGQLRTSTTSQAGTQLNTGAVASLNLSHVVYTRSSTGAVRIYVNGTQVASSTLTGNLSGWSNYELALGGEASGTRYWLGDLHLVAIYSRALTATEVRTNFLAGAN